MHIKFLSTMVWAPWGGSEVLWSQAAQRLAARGVQVSASVQGWPQTPEAVQRLREHGVEVWERRTRRPGRWQRLRWKLGLQRYTDLSESSVQDWLREGQPDLVCFSDGAVAYLPRYRRYCAEAGLPYVNLAQSNSEEFWPVDAEADEQAAVLHQARRCFFVSESNRRLCELQLGQRLRNAEVVRNPFMVDFDAKPAWPGGQSDTLRLACVGRLEPKAKGQDLLFQVLALDKWRSRPVRVTLYGKGHMADSTKRMAAMLDVQDRVDFAGHVGNIEEVWRQHHALVLPSRAEGLPLAAVEAMLCHRPVIVTDVAGNAEIVQDGETGFVAEAATVAALDAAMERAWQGREKLEQMGRAAGQSIRKLVPRDPVGVFADRLVQLAGESR